MRHRPAREMNSPDNVLLDVEIALLMSASSTNDARPLLPVHVSTDGNWGHANLPGCLHRWTKRGNVCIESLLW